MTWENSAACASRPFLFFGPERETGIERDSRESVAKTICRKCPVRDECLADAIAHTDIWGVRGGMGEKERQKYLGRLRAQAVSP